MVVIIISFVIMLLSFLASLGMGFLTKFRSEHYAVRVVTTDNIINKQIQLQDDQQLGYLTNPTIPQEEQQRLIN